jgi:hypothetical protein
MNPHPVRLQVEPPPVMDRIHVAIRLVLLIALGAIGVSSLYWVLYLALPAVAALLLSSKGAERYLAEDAPGMVRLLRWLAGAYAYLWLLTDEFPTSASRASVELAVEPGGTPTAASALWRLISSLPALILLAVLSVLAGLVWLIGAIFILARRRLPRVLGNFLSSTLQLQFRLVAYHLSLVDRYPSWEEAPLAAAPHSGAA